MTTNFPYRATKPKTGRKNSEELIDQMIANRNCNLWNFRERKYL